MRTPFPAFVAALTTVNLVGQDRDPVPLGGWQASTTPSKAMPDPRRRLLRASD
jgi:hypothetical protein